MRLSSILVVSFFLAVSGCSAGIGEPVGDSDDPSDPSDPNDPDPNEPDIDPELCVGDGGPGGVCEVTGDCDAPFVCLDGQCVGPQNPDVTCDPIEGNFCEGANEVCVAQVCVINPGTCDTTDQCPTGFLCTNGECLPDHDGACADPGPGPELAGTWDVQSNLYLREGLPGVVAGFLDASELLADFVEGDIDLGLPGPVELLIGALVESIIDQYVPVWAQDLIVALSNISDVLDTLGVDQTLNLDGLPCDANYRGSTTWDLITFEYGGDVISAAPVDIPEIGEVEPEDFNARYSCGSLYIDQHRIENTLSGLVRWIVNTVVEISTGYSSPESAIDAAFNCTAIADGINSAWQSACGCSTDVSAVVEATCTSYKNDLVAQLTAAIDEATVSLSVVSLQGVADTPDETHMLDGIWYGSVIGWDFPGDFTGLRQ